MSAAAAPPRRRPTTALGALALLVSLIGWWVDRPMFFAAWLAAWWFCLGLVLGAMANGCIHALTGGAWGDALRPASRALQRQLPWLLLLFLPLVLGLGVLYPWAADPMVLAPSVKQPGFLKVWFAPGFVGLRFVGYAAAWWWLTRPGGSGRVRRPGQAAVALIAYTLLTSLAAVDLVMSLVPGWSSTVFGWLTLMGQMTAGAAAAIALAAAAGHAPAPAEGDPPVWRDLGNLLLAWLMMQAYLQFMQFLIIWAENLPREISWFVPRLQTGWQAVGVALVLLQFTLPMLALLWRSVKDRPRRLVWVAGLVVVMQAVDAVWLVVPSVQPRGYGAWWLVPLAFAGMTLLLFGRLPGRLAGERQAEAAR